jgi:hypothetical protein
MVNLKEKKNIYCSEPSLDKDRNVLLRCFWQAYLFSACLKLIKGEKTAQYS